MVDAKKSRAKKSGLPPGTPVHIGEHKVEEVILKVHKFTEHRLEQFVISGPVERSRLKDDQMITWVSVQGLQHVEPLQALANIFDWHPLVVEDLVDTCQRPKIEDYGEYLFIVLKRLGIEDQAKNIQVEQVSIIQGSKYIVTFQEGEDDVFCHVLNRLQNDMGRGRG